MSWELREYRFRVRAGAKVVQVGTAPLPVEVPDAFTDLKWEQGEFDHGSEVRMSAKLTRAVTQPLRFVVESRDGRGWVRYATVPAVVKDGVATGVLRAHHPSLPPTGALPPPHRFAAEEHGELRFRIEEGTAPEQGKAPRVQLRPQITAPPPLCSDLKWEANRVAHGSEMRMSAKVNARPGATLHFVVEHREGTIWKEHAVVPAKVKNGLATATFKAQHKPQPDKAHLPTALRFRLEERAPAGKR